jgi:hypothetical protein
LRVDDRDPAGRVRNVQREGLVVLGQRIVGDRYETVFEVCPGVEREVPEVAV